MGGLFSKFKKKETHEVLEQIDKEISSLEKSQRLHHQRRSKVLSALLLYSTFLILLTSIGTYLVEVPDQIIYRVLKYLTIPTLCFLYYLLRKFCFWWFVRKIHQSEEQLKELKEERKDILENVMEVETYNKALKILSKFDPETKKKLEREQNQPTSSPPMLAPVGQDIRQRHNANSSGDNSNPSKPHVRTSQPTNQQQRAGGVLAPNNSIVATATGVLQSTAVPRRELARPILNPNPSTMDKIVGFLVGDGPNNRYALICQNCYAHNGMALQEEFEYIDYKCAYCAFFNPARKQKPGAPPLRGYQQRRSMPGLANSYPQLTNNAQQQPTKTSLSYTEKVTTKGDNDDDDCGIEVVGDTTEIIENSQEKQKVEVAGNMFVEELEQSKEEEEEEAVIITEQDLEGDGQVEAIEAVDDKIDEVEINQDKKEMNSTEKVEETKFEDLTGDVKPEDMSVDEA